MSRRQTRGFSKDMDDKSLAIGYTAEDLGVSKTMSSREISAKSTVYGTWYYIAVSDGKALNYPVGKDALLSRTPSVSN